MKNELYAVKVTQDGGRPTVEWAWGYSAAEMVKRVETQFPILNRNVVAYRLATAEELEAYMESASEAARQVEAEEANGSTKTLPKDWSVNSDGWTLNQFGNPV